MPAHRTLPIPDKCHVAQLLQEMLEVCSVVDSSTSGYHSQTNGRTQWFNRTLAGMLCFYISSKPEHRNELGRPFALPDTLVQRAVQSKRNYSYFRLPHNLGTVSAIVPYFGRVNETLDPV